MEEEMDAFVSSDVRMYPIAVNAQARSVRLAATCQAVPILLDSCRRQIRLFRSILNCWSSDRPLHITVCMFWSDYEKGKAAEALKDLKQAFLEAGRGGTGLAETRVSVGGEVWYGGPRRAKGGSQGCVGLLGRRGSGSSPARCMTMETAEARQAWVWIEG